MWEGHHNIEYCYGVAACRYAVKYHLKGNSYAYVRQEHANTNVVDYDEAEMMLRTQFRSPDEAYQKLYDCAIVRMDHHVVELHVHLPGHAPQYFRRDEDQQKIMRDVQSGRNIRPTQFEQYMIQVDELIHSNSRL